MPPIECHLPSLAELNLTEPIKMSTFQLTIPDMACNACATTITQAIHTLDSTATIEPDLQTKQVKITTQAPESDVTEAIRSAGYSPQS
jgi:copper chaperone